MCFAIGSQHLSSRVPTAPTVPTKTRLESIIKKFTRPCYVQATGECTVQIMSSWYVEAANYTCGNWDTELDEFELSGLTKIPSDVVKPPRCGEAALQFECQVEDLRDMKNDAGKVTSTRSAASRQFPAVELPVVTTHCLALRDTASRTNLDYATSGSFIIYCLCGALARSLQRWHSSK